MYSSFRLAKKYLHYYFTASNGKGHGMHSPFVFRFILNVLNNQSGYKPPPAIELLRQQLTMNGTVLEIEDFGAGSRTGATKKRSIQSLAKAALKPEKYAQVLYRLVCYYQPKTIVELGTSLGVTTAYLASANADATIYTLEGSRTIATIAKENFKNLALKNIQVTTGNFDDQLTTVMQQLFTINLGYIDGNHRYEPTIRYFEQLLTKMNNDSILVFDDIHWSVEMENAWEEIKRHPAVQYTIDIFFLGFVFFRAEFKVKQHFIIRF